MLLTLALVLTFLVHLINHTGIPPSSFDPLFNYATLATRVVKQSRDADETQKQIAAKSRRIAEEQKECKKLEELARADLATVEPALNEAIKVVIELFLLNIVQFQITLEFPSSFSFLLPSLVYVFINLTVNLRDF